jgi:chloramphenicol 3-O-phosphotransferase
MDTKRGNIIILNGVSSSGKTTLTKALQRAFDEHYFWIANDTFCYMCSEKFWDIDGEATHNRAMMAMFHTIKTFSDLGYNVIVDHVFVDIDTVATLEKCIEILSDYKVYFIRVDCEIYELERREKQRGDRNIGQAKYQLDHIHKHNLYDYTVDTSYGNIAELVDNIKDFVEMEQPIAFKILYKRLMETGTIY